MTLKSHCIIAIMSTSVNQLTVEQAHNEFNSLVHEIAAISEQLDSSRFGPVGTPILNTKSAELASLFAQLCSHRSVRTTRLLSAP